MKKITKKPTLITALLLASALLLSRPLHNPNRPTPPTPEVTISPSHPKPSSAGSASLALQTKSSSGGESSSTKTTKHNSKILSNNLGAPEMPYYLLGTVSDPAYASTWSLSTIQANRAWDLTTGSNATTVAVIDTGFALNHEELASKWQTNSGEVGTTQSGDSCWTGTPADKQTNACDDDQNGYTDDWRGYDFFYADNSPMAGEINPTGDGTQHGTSVAGVIAAAANNAKGSAGIDQQTKIMPLQVFSDNGAATTTDLVAAVEYATNNGADVINLSLGANGYDAPLLEAIRYAKNNGVVVVAASGNCALNDETFCNSLSGPGRMTYPALYSETVAVGATASNDLRASFSSYGSALDLVAPGSSITPLPTFTAQNQTSAYATASGTSFSAPLVSGVASLLLAQKPDLTPDEIEFILTESTEKPSAMYANSFTNEYGFGRLNAHRATLLTHAKTETNLLGDRDLSPREPSIGVSWRATTGTIASDESVLIGCRVFESDECAVTVENGSIYRFPQSRGTKGDPLRYIFVKGSSVPAGTWKISTHNRNNATFVTNLTR